MARNLVTARRRNARQIARLMIELMLSAGREVTQMPPMDVKAGCMSAARLPLGDHVPHLPGRKRDKIYKPNPAHEQMVQIQTQHTKRPLLTWRADLLRSQPGERLN